MLLKLSLQSFRSYSKRAFDFDRRTTLIVGPNASGKTNVLEAIYLLSTGKSFRAEIEKEVISEGEKVSRVAGKLGGFELEVDFDDRGRFQKLYKVNGVGKRQVDFVGNLRAVLFSPLDMEIVVNSPSTRRKYLDLVLSQVHKDYRVAAHVYERALRQRNRILKGARDQGLGVGEIAGRLEYWNQLLIENGKVIHERRKEYLNFLSQRPSSIFPIRLVYDHSIISEERLARYASSEIWAAATLVGPHRDDFVTYEQRARGGERSRNVKTFGSRGEQRMAVFAVKLGELEYVKTVTGEEPILLLDDIFSELDIDNRHHILRVIPKQQTIMTTTDARLISEKYLRDAEIVELL